MRDPWRFRCPEGHTSFRIRHTRSVMQCDSCGVEYGYKIDLKRDTKVKL